MPCRMRLQMHHARKRWCTKSVVYELVSISCWQTWRLILLMSCNIRSRSKPMQPSDQMGSFVKVRLGCSTKFALIRNNIIKCKQWSSIVAPLIEKRSFPYAMLFFSVRSYFRVLGFKRWSQLPFTLHLRTDQKHTFMCHREWPTQDIQQSAFDCALKDDD